MARNAALLSSLVGLLFFLQTTAYPQKQRMSVPLGQVVAGTVEIDGTSVPSGTTLMSGNVVQTREEPASIHLTGHRLIQLAANSKARADAEAGGAVRITLQAGTLSMRSDTGEAITLPAERVLYFTQQAGTAQQAPSERDVVAVLNSEAKVGSNSITVNDVSKIDASQPILIRRPDSEVGELHYIRSIQGNVIALTAPLSSAFPQQSLVLQGETTRAVLTEAGRPASPPGVTGPKKSKTPMIAIISGIGAGATGLIIYGVTRSDSDNDQPASPSRPGN